MTPLSYVPAKQTATNTKPYNDKYRQTSNISRTLIGNKIVDHSDVVEAPPVGAAPTTSSFSTKHLALMDWANTSAVQVGTRNT